MSGWYFSLWSKLSYWELSLVSSNLNHEVFASPKQTFEVDLYTNPPNGPLNTASISIFPGSQPLDDRAAEHVWLALLSKNTFIGQNLPFRVPGLGMREPTIITKVNSTIKDASPREMQWVNEYTKGRTSRIEGDFRWLSSSNTLENLSIPTDSQLSMYISDLDGHRKLVSFSELVVYTVTPSAKTPTEIPKIPGRNVITDYRLADFSQFGWSIQTARYTTFSGDSLEQKPVYLDSELAKIEVKTRSNIYDESAHGTKQISAALATAKKEHKHVLIQFGANWCGSCYMLHGLFEGDKDIAAELQKDYVVVMIDVNKGHNKDVTNAYGNPTRLGLPVIVVLDAEGRQLATEDTMKLVERKSGLFQPTKLMAFLKKWATKS